MKNNFLIPLAIIVAGLVVAGAILYEKNPEGLTEKSKAQVGTEVVKNKPTTPFPQAPTTPTPAGPVKIAVSKKDNVRGNFDAPVTIVEYSDFQCPFCARFHPTVQQVMNDYPGKVRWVYKHFPLSFHQNAQSAAEASECAAEQGKFWEFADKLFENQSRLGNSFYEELAGQLGLNLSQFKNCLSSRKYKDKVEADFQEGQRNGIKGTPGSFVNGKKVSGAVPYSVLKNAVEEALGNSQ